MNENENYTCGIVAVVIYAAIALLFIINEISRKRMKTLGASATVEDIEKLINEYFYPATYKVDRETLAVSNSTGERSDLLVEERNGRYYFRRK